MINQIKYNFIYVTSKKSEKKKTKTSYIYKKNISNTVKITFLISLNAFFIKMFYLFLLNKVYKTYRVLISLLLLFLKQF